MRRVTMALHPIPRHIPAPMLLNVVPSAIPTVIPIKKPVRKFLFHIPSSPEKECLSIFAE